MIPIILIYLLRFCGAQSPEVNYVVNMDSQMECCDEESKQFMDTTEVIVGHYNETIAFMHGNVKFLKDVGSNTMVEIILLKEVSGKYELLFTHMICNFCAEVALGPDSDYYGYIKYLGISEQCPFPAGDCPIKEFIMDTDDLPRNSNTAGRYQAVLTLYKDLDGDCKTNKEFMCCVNLKLLIEIV